MKFGKLLLACIAVAALAGSIAHAAEADVPVPEASGEGAMSHGVVRKIDRETGKITIKHGPLVNLGMPGMTMVFDAGNPAMLEGLKEGDAIRFVAERVNGTLTVTELEMEH